MQKSLTTVRAVMMGTILLQKYLRSNVVRKMPLSLEVNTKFSCYVVSPLKFFMINGFELRI